MSIPRTTPDPLSNTLWRSATPSSRDRHGQDRWVQVLGAAVFPFPLHFPQDPERRELVVHQLRSDRRVVMKVSTLYRSYQQVRPFEIVDQLAAGVPQAAATRRSYPQLLQEASRAYAKQAMMPYDELRPSQRDSIQETVRPILNTVLQEVPGSIPPVHRSHEDLF